MQNRLRHSGLGLGYAAGTPFKSGSRSWAQRWSTAAEVLFFAETENIVDGKLYNQKKDATDYLTVTGAAGSYTFQAPDTAAYIAADVDNIWFLPDVGNTPRTVTTAELQTYDLEGTPVKYLDSSPNTLEAIMILSSAVTGDERDQMFKDFHLPIMWDNNLSIYGRVKDNRGAFCNPWHGILMDGNTVGYYDYRDLTTITKDASNHVTRQNNKLGAAGSDLSIYGGTPLWTEDGIIYDGVDEFLKSAPFTWIQPHFIYSALKLITVTNTKRIMGGLYASSGALYISGTTIKAHAGTYSGGIAIDTNKHIVRELYNGANSKLILDNGTPVTGDFGVNTRSAFTVGAYGLAAGTADAFSNILSCHHVCRKTADSSPLETKIYNLLAKLNGFATI